MNICFIKTDTRPGSLNNKVYIKNVHSIEFDGSDLIIIFAARLHFEEEVAKLGLENHYLTSKNGLYIVIEASHCVGSRTNGFNGYVLFETYYPYFEISSGE